MKDSLLLNEIQKLHFKNHLIRQGPLILYLSDTTGLASSLDFARKFEMRKAVEHSEI
jgi:hypothetical protein